MISPQSRADIESSGSALQGFYRVISSSDSMFPMTRGREWFLDFGKGVPAGKTYGSVIVSLRENPNLKIRILVWQYFPENGTLVIGNPTEPGSKQAVARALWKIQCSRSGVRLQRGQQQVTLRRADPAD